MDITIEPLSTNLLIEMQPLIESLHAEVGEFADWPLVIDYDPYWFADSMGKLVIATGRDEGKLQGFVVFFIQDSPMFDKLFGIQDVYYVNPKMRGKMLGYRLLREAEKELKYRGVHVVSAHHRTTLDFGRMLELMGYEASEIHYFKRVG